MPTIEETVTAIQARILDIETKLQDLTGKDKEEMKGEITYLKAQLKKLEDKAPAPVPTPAPVPAAKDPLAALIDGD